MTHVLSYSELKCIFVIRFFVDFYPSNNDSHMILQYIFFVDISRVCHITTVYFESKK